MSTDLVNQLLRGTIQRAEITVEDREAYIHAYLLGAVLPDETIMSADRVRIESKVQMVRRLWNP